MGEHEPCIGASDDWYTPADLLEAIGESYDLDPCAPGYGRAYYSVKAAREYTTEHDGLKQPWDGFVFMNPPFGGRNGHVPWLVKFLEHGNGIAIVRAYTSSAWFHEHAVKADVMLFPRGKTQFVRPDGEIGKSPGHGIVLLGMGERAVKALQQSGLGLCLRLSQTWRREVSLAYDIVDRILDDLTDRRGLRQEWDNIDTETQVEIIEKWQGIVRDELMKRAKE